MPTPDFTPRFAYFSVARCSTFSPRQSPAKGNTEARGGFSFHVHD
jgi:hypothetical protein